jgi:predicted nucleic acid-binding protein
MARPVGGAPARLFVDSSVWLAYLSARDGRHAAADELIREAVAREATLLTSNLVLAEVQRLLLFRAGSRPAVAAIERISSSPSVSILFPDVELHLAALAWLSRFGDQELSYTDATSFCLMKHHRCSEALSFDRDFVFAGFTLWAP